MNKKLSFQYKNGRLLKVGDNGNEGVNLSLTDDHDERIGIGLPPRIVNELGLWLCDTNGQTVNKLPIKMLAILKELMLTEISKPARRVIKRVIKVLEEEKAKDGQTQNQEH